MRVLIDTHILIWYLNGNSELPTRLLEILERPENKVSISKVSLWELTIKISSKKLEIEKSLADIQTYIKEKDVELLDINFDALITLSNLPFYHKDPFDRLLIAQAISEGLPIISVDRYFQAYPIIVIQ